jgi:arginyl-tRNA synthetase
MKQEAVEIIQKALEVLQETWGLEEIPDIDIEIPKKESQGDLATTVAMGLARTLKKTPRKIAEELLTKIEDQNGPFEKIEIAGPGFINFTFKKEFLYNGLRQLLEEGHFSHITNIGKGRKVQIEFVSANPTGPLHIGHGRGAAVGNALSNLLRTAGFDVEKEFYINDAGLQVRLLGHSVYARYQQMAGNDIPFPEEGYRGEYVEHISEEIRKEAGEKYLRQPFQECGQFFTDYAYRMMLSDIEKDLKDFGIVFDTWQSERDLYEGGKVRESFEALRDKDLIYEKDGATWFRSTEFQDDKDRVVIKKDGAHTYFASDIAYHRDKLNRGFDTIIDIWGADHHGYIPRLKSVLKVFGLSEEKFIVILIQMVTLLRHGEPVQMSKRSGEFITLREVIDEVGVDTAKFIFLTRRADSQLEFDIEVAKEQSAENPVFYIQYAFARISSIFRQAKEREIINQEQGPRITDKGDALAAVLSELKEDEEMALIKKILHYPLAFEGAVLSFEPHRLTYYLQELAGQFHPYYNKHRVISDEPALTSARLGLCRAVQIALEDGLTILGVNAPERM